MIRRIDDYRMKITKGDGRLTEATVYLRNDMTVEDQAINQLADATRIDADARVFGTPDIHSGYGVPIGSVFASPNFISPSAVGYDVNCGMRLITTPFGAGEIDVPALATSIHRDIPLGEGRSNMAVETDSLKKLVEGGVKAYADVVKEEPELQKGFDEDDLMRDITAIEDEGSMEGDASAVSVKALQRGRTQIGSLGGGNHFIELQAVQAVDDEEVAAAWGVREGQLVVMIHSGSRGFGHEVAGQYMRAAKSFCEWQDIELPNRQLAFIPAGEKLALKYMAAMRAAANYAFINRQAMAQLVRRNIRYMHGADLELPLIYDVPHNIAKLEEADGTGYWVHRKGATRAFSPAKMAGTRFEKTGQPVLIPGSMGTASYLLAGVESGSESMYTVNHGAGRVMSRTAAAGKRKGGKVVVEGAITPARFKESMKGVHLICNSEFAIREEAPDAYKDIDAVIDTVRGAGLARVVARMVPLAVLKG